LKKRNTQLNNVPKQKVQFNLVDNLKALLISFDQNNDKEKLKYNNLICDLRDAGIEIKVSIFLIIKEKLGLVILILTINILSNIKSIIKLEISTRAL